MNWIIEPTFLSNLPLWITITIAIIIVEVYFVLLVRRCKEKSLLGKVIISKLVAALITIGTLLGLMMLIMIIKVIAVFIIPIALYFLSNYLIAKYLLRDGKKKCHRK